MPAPSRQSRRLAHSARAKAVLQPRDFARLNIHPQQVSRLVAKGELVRVGRGRYVLAGHQPSENLGLALVSAAAPQAVVCLLSALQFHGIGTQSPREVWIAVEKNASRPRLDQPPIRLAVFSGTAFTFGVERHVIDGIPIKVYSAAKTVADCFKFRNKIGLDAALEALREGLRAKRFNRDSLWAAAKVCRVTTVIRPYLEVL
jgi:predicted transcriptional regulator of viral defense system